MNSRELLVELQHQICDERPMSEQLDQLRKIRDTNTPSTEVIVFLESLRAQHSNSPIEDHILELLDYVTGFCNPKYQIWNDEL